jgi:hypothetical protein
VVRALTANAKVATVLSPTTASSDTLESEGRQMKQCRIKCIKNNQNIEFNGKNTNILVIFGNSYLQTTMEEINTVV